MAWIFVGIVACVSIGWYLYRRSKNDAAEDTDQTADAETNDDEFEDLLWTGVLLNEIYDDDEQRDPSDDTGADDYDVDDGGFDDGGGFE
ncbi:hypothetical protein C6496_06210 [Candidatus Poribacteria bacterium]|nr:MAG: hypothetical protein C6496_06210 [Candidatus Poribacteria bacterium]